MYWSMNLKSFSQTSHWWQPSTALLMIVPISIFFPHSCFIDLLCPGCTRTFGHGGCPTMQQSGLSLLLFLCAFFMTSFHLFSIVAFASGINIAWNERSFVFASRFLEACVSERQISRIFWTICNSRFPKFAELNNIRSSYFSLPKISLESILYSPDFEVYWKNLVSQIRCAARRDNMCLLSPSEKVRWRAFLRSFHRNEFLGKVVIRYRIPSFPAFSIQLNLFCLRCFGFSPNPPPAPYISSRKSFVQ